MSLRTNKRYLIYLLLPVKKLVSIYWESKVAHIYAEFCEEYFCVHNQILVVDGCFAWKKTRSIEQCLIWLSDLYTIGIIDRLIF